jgi:hypothetical protein
VSGTFYGMNEPASNSQNSQRPGVSSGSASPTDAEAVVGEVELFLKNMLLQMSPDLVEARRDGPGRPRVLPSLALWAGLLVCVLKGFSSKLDLWRLLSKHQLWFYPRFPVTDQAVYDRLEREGTSPMEQLFCQISSILKDRLSPFALKELAPFAAEVLALDETTLDPVARKLPSLRSLPKGDKRLLPGKLAGLFDLRHQQWVRIQHISNPDQNEKIAARAMVEALPKSSLILADLGYFGFAWLDHLTDRGYYWISRLRAKTSYQILHVYYRSTTVFDGLVHLGVHRADRAAHAVRLVQFQVNGTTYSYLTNLTKPQQLPIQEIARLYARRWDIELAINLVKTHLKLHLLWSPKTSLVLQQIYAVLIISQILQALRMEIAGRAKVDPFDVSMELMIRWMPQYAYEGQDPVAGFVLEGRDMGFIRPSRRTVIKAPVIPMDQIRPAPGELVLVRTPRYAQKTGRHSPRAV